MGNLQLKPLAFDDKLCCLPSERASTISHNLLVGDRMSRMKAQMGNLQLKQIAFDDKLCCLPSEIAGLMIA